MDYCGDERTPDKIVGSEHCGRGGCTAGGGVASSLSSSPKWLYGVGTKFWGNPVGCLDIVFDVLQDSRMETEERFGAAECF